MLVALLLAAPALLMTTQGRLLDTADAPVSAQVTLTFSFFDNVQGGTKLWSDSFTVTPSQGVYGVTLGDTTVAGHEAMALPASAFAADAWLEVAVGAEALTPRLRVGTVPSAVYAGTAGSVTSNGATVTLDAHGKWPASALSIPTNVATLDENGKLPLSLLETGTAGLDAASVGGHTAQDATAGDKALALLVNGALPVGELPSNVALTTSGKLDPSVLPSSVALTTSGKLDASVLPSTVPLTVNGTIPASLLPAAGDAPSVDGHTTSDATAGDHAIPLLVSGKLPGALLPATPVIATAASTVNAPTCDKDHAGLIYFDTTQSTFLGCNGSGFQSLTPPADGSLSSRAGVSCKSIKALKPNAADGLYWVNPDGSSSGPVQVFCDMTTDGGGYIVCARQSFDASGRAFGHTQLSTSWGTLATTSNMFGTDCASLMARLRPGGQVELLLKSETSGEWQWVWPLDVTTFYNHLKGNQDSTGTGSCETSVPQVTQCKGSQTSSAVAVAKYIACHNYGQHRTSDNYFIWQFADSINSQVLMEIGTGDVNHPVGIRPNCGTTGWWGGCTQPDGISTGYEAASFGCNSGRSYGVVSIGIRER